MSHGVGNGTAWGLAATQSSLLAEILRLWGRWGFSRSPIAGKGGSTVQVSGEASWSIVRREAPRYLRSN